MLKITLSDGVQVSVSVDRDGHPIVSERAVPYAIWDPVPADRIEAGPYWHEFVGRHVRVSIAARRAADQVGKAS